jgi:hypothetical protein
MQKIFILLFLLSGTAFAQKNTPALTIGSKDNGKTFQVKKGNYFTAVFRECVGCASSYRVEKMDTLKIALIRTTYSNRSCTNCTGGNQDVTFLFKSKAKGKSALQFTYFKETVHVKIITNK